MQDAIGAIGLALEWAGITVMVVGAAVATAKYALGLARADDHAYTAYRSRLGRAILLGLEFLVAGDIIDTVAVDPTLDTVVVLGLIVLIRTFLSFTLSVEIEGRWPWQAARSEGSR